MGVSDNIIFLGAMYSDNQKGYFLKNSKRGYQFAAQNLQESYLDGLEKNEVNVKVLSFPPLSTYPAGCRIKRVESGPFVYNGRTLGYNLGYINLPFINHPSRKEAVSIIEEWIHNFTKPFYIVVYSLNRFLMSVAMEVKRHHSNIKLCIIIPDLLEYMGCNKYYKMLGLQKKDIKDIYQMLPCFDKYILLAESMASRLGIAKNDYSIIEGIYKEEKPPMFSKEKEIVILYTGGLSVRYGIPDLLEAFSHIKYDNYRLWLCGYGDAVSLINNFAEKDDRIKYWGQIPKEKVLELQKRATLLVNPRHSDEDFTKYSFPSKTMEYLASGTPMVMCHLRSIPIEYNNYLFYFEDETAEGMRKKLMEICEKPSKELKEYGKIAEDFIRAEKSSKVQLRKFLDFIR